MIAREVGEPRRRQPDAIQPALINPVRGCLHRHRSHTITRKPRQIFMQRHRIRRCQRWPWRQALRNQPQRAERSCFPAGIAPNLAQKIHAACLAIRAGDRHHAFRLHAIKSCRHQRQGTAWIGAGHQRAQWRIGRPSSAFGRQNCRRTACHGIGNEAAPISTHAGQCRENHPRPHRAAISRDTRYVQ